MWRESQRLWSGYFWFVLFTLGDFWGVVDGIIGPF
jgi:hypothetical protein